jgi:hypothetical protein
MYAVMPACSIQRKICTAAAAAAAAACCNVLQHTAADQLVLGSGVWLK